MKAFKEFREFAIKGNMVDMAVGFILGAAFGKIVSSLVENVLMPPIGLLVGGTNVSDLAITLRAANGARPAVLWRYGAFLQNLMDFLLVTIALFLVVKAVSAWRRQREKGEEGGATPPAGPLQPTLEEQLLTEIRDLLKAQQG